MTFELDHSTEPPRITANGKPVPYETFVSFFVKYIGLSANGYDAVARTGTTQAGAQTTGFKTTYLDGQTTQVRLLERDAGSKYIQVNDQASFYISNEKVELLIDRLDAALAAGK